MRPAIARAPAPEPQKKSPLTFPLIADPVSCATIIRLMVRVLPLGAVA